MVEGLRLGAHDYLRKPFEPSELLARVHAAVRSKALQDELRLRNAELELASRTDALTGLSNRRRRRGPAGAGPGGSAPPPGPAAGSRPLHAVLAGNRRAADLRS